MRVLVACERSGIVRDAFRACGHYAISCDILPSENGGPHAQCDVRRLLQEPWDLVVAHPPCNYLSNINRWMGNDKNPGFMKSCDDAITFFLECYNANAPKICVENPMPTPYVSERIGPYTTYVEPWHFGDPYKKKTLLWTKGLPSLIPTEFRQIRTPWVNISTSQNFTKITKGLHGQAKGRKKAKVDMRSQSFPGIAKAMAEQWGDETRWLL